MSFVRYNRGYQNMQDTMNSLVNALFNVEFTTPEENGTAPLMDMKETADAFIMKFTMPGLEKDAIDISVTDGILTVKGETKEEEADENTTFLVRENNKVSYCRAVRLPSEVEADKASAEYKNGVLNLTLPKAEEVKPKSIPVNIAD